MTAVLLSIAAFTGWRLGSRDGRETLITFTATRVDVSGNQLFAIREDGSGLSQLTHDDELKIAVAWSPNGSLIAFASVTHNGGIASLDDGGGSSISVVRPDGTERRLLCRACSRNAFTVPPPPDCFDCLGPTDVLVPDTLAWSPDGSTLATPAIGGGVFLIDADSGDLRRISTPKAPTALAWSPDGRRLAVSHSWFLSAYSGDVRIPEWGHPFPADGPRKGSGGIYLIDPSTGRVEEVLATDGVAHVHDWMPNGDVVVFGRIVGHGKHAELAAYSVSNDRSRIFFAGESGFAHLGVSVSSAGGVAGLIGHYNEEGQPIGLATTAPGGTEPKEVPACRYERAVDSGVCALPSLAWSPSGNTIAYRGALAGAPLTAVIVVASARGETIDVLPLEGLFPDYGSCCLRWHEVT